MYRWSDPVGNSWMILRFSDGGLFCKGLDAGGEPITAWTRMVTKDVLDICRLADENEEASSDE